MPVMPNLSVSKDLLNTDNFTFKIRRHFCGAVLIGPDTALTAAHCDPRLVSKPEGASLISASFEEITKF